MKSRPVIGITTESKKDKENPRTGGVMSLNWNYAESVWDAGGTPLLVPPMVDVSELVDLLDGWLIPGGLDIDPTHFGQEVHPESELQDPSRFKIEKALFEGLPVETPILGICYGCQFLNVVRGGSLHQHLPENTEIPHTGGPVQEYRVEPGTKLALAVGSTVVSGKSYHHQGIDSPGAGVRVVARHEDGTIEGIELEDRPWVVAVQWHPERTIEDPAMKSLFQTFVDRARENMQQKRLVSEYAPLS